MRLYKYFPAMAAALVVGCSAVFAASADDGDVQIVMPSEPEYMAEEAVTDQTKAEDIDSVIVNADITDSTTSSDAFDAETEDDAGILFGWSYFDDERICYYDESNVMQTGFIEIDGNYYYFAPNGTMKTGWITVDGVRMYFDTETGIRNTGWVEYMDSVYYDDPVKGKLIGIQEINGETYIFNESGALYRGWFEYGNCKYYGGEDGAVRKGETEIDGVKYIFSPSGRYQSGWQTINGLRIFYDYDSAEILYGWINYNGLVYFADVEHGKYTGEHDIDGIKYRFSDKGFLAVGLQKFEDGTRYYYKDGSIAKGFVNDNGNVYYFDEQSCLMQTGFIKYDGNGYFFGADGIMKTGLQEIEGNKYYFSEDGVMQTGIVRVGSDYYFFDSDGTMKTGFRAEDGEIYYFSPENGKMLYFWQTVNGERYYFGHNGKMRTGFVSIDGKIYYFNGKGIMSTGWKTINNKKYYFGDNGVARVGWQTFDGKKYYFNEKGEMATDLRTINDKRYYFGSDGVMKTGWQTVRSKKYYFGTDGAAYTYRHNIDNVNYCFYSDGSMVTGGNQDIVAKALTQLGNVGGKPYWTWWGFDFRIEWCACFVSWCANQCGYTQDGSVPEFISCAVGITWFKQHGQWKNKESYTPISGDYIFFDWEPDGIADHIGIVDYCENGYVYTIEGNSSDQCRRRSYKLTDIRIFGYARPSFQP